MTLTGGCRLSVEKLTCEVSRRLARLEELLFRLISKLWVLVRGKVIFGPNDAELTSTHG